jgi:hypothetical protein
VLQPGTAVVVQFGQRLLRNQSVLTHVPLEAGAWNEGCAPWAHGTAYNLLPRLHESGKDALPLFVLLAHQLRRREELLCQKVALIGVDQCGMCRRRLGGTHHANPTRSVRPSEGRAAPTRFQLMSMLLLLLLLPRDRVALTGFQLLTLRLLLLLFLQLPGARRS